MVLCCSPLLWLEYARGPVCVLVNSEVITSFLHQAQGQLPRAAEPRTTGRQTDGWEAPASCHSQAEHHNLILSPSVFGSHMVHRVSFRRWKLHTILLSPLPSRHAQNLWG